MASVGTQLDASDVLAAALEQMDGIIAGTKLGFQNGLNDNQSLLTFPSNRGSRTEDVCDLLRQLRHALEMRSDDNDNLATLQQIDPEVALFVFHWLESITSDKKSSIQSGGYEELQDRLHHVHGERENLMLQVSVLSEQVDAQAEKMRELESTLEERREQLETTEDLCRREMQSRSSLMEEAAELRSRLSEAEREKKELLERLRKLEAEFVSTREKANEKEVELVALKTVLARNGTINTATEYVTQIEKLKKSLDDLVASNEEKDKTIEELALVVSRQKRIQEWIPSERRVSDPTSPDRGNDLLVSPQSFDSSKSVVLEKPPPVPRGGALCSTPISSTPGWPDTRFSPSPSQISLRSFHKSGSAENILPPPSNASTGSRTPPAKRHYSTLPRQHGAQVLQQIQQQLQQHRMEPHDANVVVHSSSQS